MYGGSNLFTNLLLKMRATFRQSIKRYLRTFSNNKQYCRTDVNRNVCRACMLVVFFRKERQRTHCGRDVLPRLGNGQGGPKPVQLCSTAHMLEKLNDAGRWIHDTIFSGTNYSLTSVKSDVE